jgi:hypothetical protein
MSTAGLQFLCNTLFDDCSRLTGRVQDLERENKSLREELQKFKGKRKTCHNCRHNEGTDEDGDVDCKLNGWIGSGAVGDDADACGWEAI